MSTDDRDTGTDSSGAPVSGVNRARAQAGAQRHAMFRRLLAAGILGATIILGVGVWVVYGLDATPGMATPGMATPEAGTGPEVEGP